MPKGIAPLILGVFIFCSALLPGWHADAGDSAMGTAAQERGAGEDSSSRPVLDPVMVTAARIPSEANRVPAAVTAVEAEEFRRGRPALKLDEALERVPGVFVQNGNNFAQDLRISMRGFGARSAFGIRGIQVYMDGLPQTLADGQTALDAIDPDAVERLEVLRGPVSSLYGNASGGVISITTREGPAAPEIAQRTVIGEDGLLKNVLQGGGQAGRLNGFASLAGLQVNGYRAHSEAESTTFNTKLRLDVDDASDVTMVFNAVNIPEARDPGGLTREQAQSDPTRAAALSRLYDARESIEDRRLGLVYRRETAAGHELEAAGFFGRRELDNAVPFRYIDLSRDVIGGRIQYALGGTLLDRSHRAAAGIELQRQSDDRRNLNNIDGRAGETVLLAQDETVTATGLYLQEQIDLMPRWSVLLGGRYDHVRFEVDDRLRADGDDSGAKAFDQFTGRLGLMFALHPHVRLYGTVAQSFETPTGTEIVNRPEGGAGINPRIEPQTAVNYEIGARIEMRDNFSLEAALFRIDLSDELIAFRDATDRVFYRNAGESRRTGAELGLTRRFLDHWQVRLAYAYLKAQFEEYAKQGTDLGGNRVPGLPEHWGFFELRYTHASGVYAAGSAAYTDDFHADDENTVRNHAATVVDMRLGWEKRWRHWRIEPFMGVRNLLDEAYNSNVRINAAGGRYFEPAPGRNVYGGLGIGYVW